MGLFSSKKTQQTTNVTTNTTTNIRDIGLSGQHAVDLASVVMGSLAEQQKTSVRHVDNLVQQTGRTAQQLIGGASSLVQTGQAQVKEIARATQGQFEKIIPWLAVAGVALILVAYRN